MRPSTSPWHKLSCWCSHSSSHSSWPLRKKVLAVCDISYLWLFLESPGLVFVFYHSRWLPVIQSSLPRLQLMTFCYLAACRWNNNNLMLSHSHFFGHAGSLHWRGRSWVVHLTQINLKIDLVSPSWPHPLLASLPRVSVCASQMAKNSQLTDIRTLYSIGLRVENSSQHFVRNTILRMARKKARHSGQLQERRASHCQLGGAAGHTMGCQLQVSAHGSQDYFSFAEGVDRIS